MKIPVCNVSNYIHIDDLKLHPDNPREISSERLEDLKNSIMRKGLYQPILVWQKRNIVLSGNHRLMAMKMLIDEGHTFVNGKRQNEIPVVLEDVTESKAKAILFDSNNNYADWIEEKLRAAIKGASTETIAQYGFAPGFVDKLLSDALDSAKEILDKKEILPVDLNKLSEAMDEEKQRTIVISKEAYENLLEVVAPIAKRINPKWRESDDISPALIQFVDSYWGLQPHKKGLQKKVNKIQKDLLEDSVGNLLEDAALEEI